MARIFPRLAAALVAVLCGIPSTSSALAGAVGDNCRLKGIKLQGKVQVVEHFPDLKVKQVTHFPDACGKWQVVEHFPDFKVQFVEHFPDLKIQYVEHFPGVP